MAGQVGAAAFEAHYAARFGARWPALREALLAEAAPVAWRNPFAPGEPAWPDGAREVDGVPGCHAAPRFDAPSGSPRPYYLLDAASVVAARALEVQAGDRVLDLCAAPGGKTLVLAAALAEAGHLVANDRSAARRARLHRVLDEHLPEAVRARVEVKGHDAARWGLHERATYDRVLLDAPCSSERHVIADAKALAKWSPARSRQLAKRQYAILAAAIDAVRPGGRVVYATCALADEENDGVVARLMKRRAGQATLVRPEVPFGEATEHGVRILPDATGHGPIYLAVLERAMG